MENALKFLFAALCCLVLASTQANDLPLPFEANLKRVIDGDSVMVTTADGQETEIRVWGIDAPEFGAPFSRQSTRGLKRLLRGHTLLVEPVTFDRYNRLVAEIFAGGVNSGIALVDSGLAWVYRRYNNRRDYIDAQRRAVSSTRGLWSDPAASSMPPWEWRKLNKRVNPGTAGCDASTAAIIGNRRSMIFHHRGCPDYQKVACSNRVEFASAQDALTQGFRAARNCKARP